MATLPVLPFLYGFSITKKPTFKTIVQNFKSGREVTTAQQIYPLWEFELKYETLKDQTQNQTPYPQNLGFTAFENLSSIYTFCNGQYGRFLYEDLSDNSRAGQVIGTGDGATTVFNVLSTILDVDTGNSFTQIVGRVNQGHSVTVYVNGTPLPSAGNWGIATNGFQLVFVNPPAPGAVITMDFFYYYSCRFISDEQDFEQFVMNWWTASLKFRSTSSGVANPVPLLSSWRGSALSSDGSIIVMAATNEEGGTANGYVWISHDTGHTWTKNLALGKGGWGVTKMSSNGQYILVAQDISSGMFPHNIYLSQDSGASWAPISPGALSYGSFAMSDDGSIMVANSSEDPNFDQPTHFWYSSDHGSTWTAGTDVIGSYQQLWMAPTTDGTNIWVSQNNFPATNKILHSSNSGHSYAGVSAFPIGPSTGFNLVSGDGTKVMAAASVHSNPGLGSFFCWSTNSGVTWTQGVSTNTPEPSSFAATFCSSRDGSIGYALYFISGGNPSALHKTTDWWQTFGGNIGPTRPTNFGWYQFAINCSYDGLVIVVPDESANGNGEGAIAISRDGGATWGVTVPVDFA